MDLSEGAKGKEAMNWFISSSVDNCIQTCLGRWFLGLRGLSSNFILVRRGILKLGEQIGSFVTKLLLCHAWPLSGAMEVRGAATPKTHHTHQENEADEPM